MPLNTSIKAADRLIDSSPHLLPEQWLIFGLPSGWQRLGPRSIKTSCIIWSSSLIGPETQRRVADDRRSRSNPVIAKIVGWSPGTMAKMAAPYGHFGIEELRSAVESISVRISPEIAAEYPQNPPRSTMEPKNNIN